MHVSTLDGNRHRVRPGRLVCVMFLGLFLAATSPGADWPQWRGPNHDGISNEQGWLTNWPPTQVWKASIGFGESSVTVSDGRLYTMGTEADGGPSNIVTYCLDAKTGTNLWTYSYQAPRSAAYRPCATPTVHSNEVYVLDDEGKLSVLNKVTGALLWEANAFINRSTVTWEDTPLYASSPLIDGDLVYLNTSGLGCAINRNPPHEIVWPVGTPSERAGYSAVVPMTIQSQPVLLVLGQTALQAIDPITGSNYWSYAYGSENLSDPVVWNDKILLLESGTVLLNPTLEVTEEWYPKISSSERKTWGSVPVIVDDHAYAINGDGELMCIEVNTGTIKWKQSDFVTLYGYYATGCMTGADGKLIILSDGKLRVVKADPTGFNEEGRSAVVLSTDETEVKNFARTTPTLANGLIYCRLNTNIWCFQAGALPPSATNDSDGDGLTDLEEDAYGSDPNSHSSANRPGYAITQVGGTNYFSLSYTRATNSWFADITVEVSSNLTTWSAGPAVSTTHSVTNFGNGTEGVIERMTQPMNNASRGFMRTKVTPK